MLLLSVDCLLLNPRKAFQFSEIALFEIDLFWAFLEFPKIETGSYK